MIKGCIKESKEREVKPSDSEIKSSSGPKMKGEHCLLIRESWEEERATIEDRSGELLEPPPSEHAVGEEIKTDQCSRADTEGEERIREEREREEETDGEGK